MCKSKWDDVKDKLLLIEAWCRDGYTDEMVMTKLGISKPTFYEYQKKYPNFLNSIRRGKEVTDVVVENSLLKNANGYIYTEKQAIKVKDVEVVDGKAISIERVEIIEVERFKPAETTAQIFWLKNRKPAEWRDRKDIDSNINVTGETSNKIDFSRFSVEQIREMLK